MISITCDTCGENFSTKKSNADRSKHHFCSRICWGKWRAKQQIGEKNKKWGGGSKKACCELCKKDFFYYPNNPNQKHSFCSQDCYTQWRKEQSKLNTITCIICGKVKQSTPYRLKCGKDKTCSKTCEGILKSQLRNGSNNPMFGRTQTSHTRKQISNAHKGKKRTLEECRRMSDNSKKGGEHPNWRGGSSFLPYCYKFNGRRRRAVRQFFQDLCICCGKHVTENITKRGQVDLSVHHIDHDKNTGCNGKPFNLVPLCHECHGKEQHNKQEYINYINNTLEEGFKWGIWSREQYELDVMYPE